MYFTINSLKLLKSLILLTWQLRASASPNIASRSNFLVHVNVLARLFRGKMLAMLMHAHNAAS